MKSVGTTGTESYQLNVEKLFKIMRLSEFGIYHMIHILYDILPEHSCSE